MVEVKRINSQTGNDVIDMQGDMNSESKIKALFIGHENAITSVTQDDQFVLTGSADSTARL